MAFMQNKEDKNTKRFYPKNKHKIKSNNKYFISRSSWEYQFMQWLDTNQNILYWESEPIAINYQHPIEMRSARYYADFLIKCKNKKGEEEVWLIEVKPKKETSPPSKKGNKSKKTLLYEHKTWKINEAKWKAAIKYCKMKGWKFKIITEKELHGK